MVVFQCRKPEFRPFRSSMQNSDSDAGRSSRQSSSGSPKISEAPSWKDKFKIAFSGFLIAIVVTGCRAETGTARAVREAGAQAMPVKTVTVEPHPCRAATSMCLTHQTRCSATIMPQVPGNLVKILVHVLETM